MLISRIALVTMMSEEFLLAKKTLLEMIKAIPLTRTEYNSFYDLSQRHFKVWDDKVHDLNEKSYLDFVWNEINECFVHLPMKTQEWIDNEFYFQLQLLEELLEYTLSAQEIKEEFSYLYKNYSLDKMLNIIEYISQKYKIEKPEI